MTLKEKELIEEPIPVQTTFADGKTMREFLCGWGAAFINVVITFPINKIMFRQMLQGVGTQKAWDELKIEGAAYLYRGVLPPLVQKTFSVSLMFAVYEKTGQLLSTHYPEVSPGMGMFVSAMCAGTTEAILTPLERIQTLLQDPKYHLQYRNTYHITKSLRPYGISEYFRGVTPILMRNGPSNVLFFGLRTEFQKRYPKTDFMFGRVMADFISGALIGAIISTIFYPVNVVKARMQTQIGGSYPSVYSVFKTIYAERDYNIKRFFHGVHLNYTRALLSWGIINASYEFLKKSIPNL